MDDEEQNACADSGYSSTDDLKKIKEGRTIHRLINEDVKIKLEKQYLKKESKEIYKLRKQKVELPFGHIKRNLGVNSFLLRGLDGVNQTVSQFHFWSLCGFRRKPWQSLSDENVLKIASLRSQTVSQ
ncbi:MAG: transposase [Elusimicrobiota bacterium]